MNPSETGLTERHRSSCGCQTRCSKAWVSLGKLKAIDLAEEMKSEVLLSMHMAYTPVPCDPKTESTDA